MHGAPSIAIDPNLVQSQSNAPVRMTQVSLFVRVSCAHPRIVRITESSTLTFYNAVPFSEKLGTNHGLPSVDREMHHPISVFAVLFQKPRDLNKGIHENAVKCAF